MRAFIVLGLIAVACADKLGYNYRPVGHSDSGLSFQPGSGGSIGGGSIGGGSLGGGSLGGGSIGDGLLAPSAEWEKEFYSFSAPENEFNDDNAAQRIASSLKKNLRVIFIKSPENKGLENAALNLAKQAADQQTAIYVLHKQADVGDLANKLNAIRNNNNQRPEVHFVKYRTPEDAANAQHAIQSQYDSLGGTSQAHNGGVAPVLNFASQAPVSHSNPQSPGNAYLPSSIFRLRF
ncbi:uncharacterized protein LOC119684661 isoform X6 [Teleopsis dalmanni]|uniref:uncharacterized protein LOC119684661 isoform X6 n=1 Tax=Teleopsis dalmanni TaxID=139649 RepID=UPI0018CF31B8|nr:uncharacterized protein LOC119684661 isoform X6 [Teleopsis dalmanni]